MVSPLTVGRMNSVVDGLWPVAQRKSPAFTNTNAPTIHFIVI
jgi:hypothetical protein